MEFVVVARAARLKALCPQRSSAARIFAHSAAQQVKVVLQKVRVRPNGLVGIRLCKAYVVRAFNARNATGYLLGGSRGPRRTVAGIAAQLIEHFASALHVFVRKVACGRNGQSAVPDHETGIVVVSLLGWKRIRIGGSHVEAVCRQAKGLHRIYPLLGGIQIAAVGACDVGDVPHCVGTGSVAQPGTRKAVGPASHVALAVFFRNVVDGSHRLAIGTAVLFIPLGYDVVVGDTVEKSGTRDANRALNVAVHHSGQASLHLGQNLRLVHRDHRIAQGVGRSVGEGVAMLVGSSPPLYGESAFVEGSLIGGYGLRLQHTRELR